MQGLGLRNLPRPLVLLLIAMLCLALGGLTLYAQPSQAQRGQEEKCSKQEEFVEVPGQGRSCRLPNGFWRVKLRDGSTIDTHGPDSAAEAEADALPAADTSAAAVTGHTCVSTSTYHGLIIYAYPSNQADRTSTLVGTIRNNFQGAVNKLAQEFAEFGQSGSYKMACNASGDVTVRTARLTTTTASDSFSTIVSDLKALGYNSTLAKYWIWYDAGLGACGQGGVMSDDRLIASNANNVGPSYGISYACNAMMHENGHNLGAVQHSAPNSSGAWHCNDDQDVMCYNDGGPRSGGFRTNACTDREHFDCGHNDYFHPNPPAGNYLATHWNLGSCLNRFIQRSGCGTIPPTATRTNTSGTGPTPTRTSTPSGSTNRALNKAATGSSPCASSETPPKAVDGATANNSKFCSLVASKWLRVDLGASFSLTRFVVKHAGAGGESTAWNTSAFNIQTSADNATWTTVVTVSGNTASTTSHTIAARSARYVRLNITTGAQSGQANTARIYELEVY